MKILQPPGWAKPKGYSNGIAAAGGTTVFIAGQVAFNSQNIIEEKTFAGQFRQTLKNTLAVLAEAGGKPEHIVRMTWYITDKKEYLARDQGGRRGVPRADRQALPGDGGGAGGRADGRRGEGRDRDHGGRPMKVSIVGGGPGGLVLRAAGAEGLAALGHHGLRAQPPGRHLRLRRGVLGPDAGHLQGLRRAFLRDDPAPLRLLGRRRRGGQGPRHALGRQRFLRLLARGAAAHPARPLPRTGREAPFSEGN